MGSGELFDGLAKVATVRLCAAFSRGADENDGEAVSKAIGTWAAFPYRDTPSMPIRFASIIVAR